MTTDGFLLWSPATPLGILLFTTAAPPALGAGADIVFFPFTAEFALPCCAGTLAPAADELDSVGAGEEVFVAALAYDRIGSCAGTAVRGDVFPGAEDAAAVADWAAFAGV